MPLFVYVAQHNSYIVFIDKPSVINYNISINTSASRCEISAGKALAQHKIGHRITQGDRLANTPSKNQRKEKKMGENLTRGNLYLVSDVHSYYSSLMRALTKAGFFEDETGTLVLLGDALDRGTEHLELIKFLLKLKEEGRLIYIRGNHEELLSDMMQSISNRSFQSKFYSYAVNGTYETGISLVNMYYDYELEELRYYAENNWCYMDHDKAQEYSEEFATRIRESKYYRELHRYAVDYLETEHYVFCHGWIPVSLGEGEGSYSYDPEWRDAEYTAWRRARWLNGMEVAVKHGAIIPDKTVVCGHFNTAWGHNFLHGNTGRINEPFVDYGIIAIDAGTYSTDTLDTKRINCVVIQPDGKAIYEGNVIYDPADPR